MNETEQMIHKIDGFLGVIGESPLKIPDDARGSGEMALLKAARVEYTERLLQRVSEYALGRKVFLWIRSYSSSQLQ